MGGGSVHWAGFTPRFHPSDFHVSSRDGVGADWPISYEDIKPYYELLEKEIPVSGPAYFPWGDPHGYSYGPHPMGGVGDILIKGCTALGIRVSASAGPSRSSPGHMGSSSIVFIAAFVFRAARSVPNKVRWSAMSRMPSLTAQRSVITAWFRGSTWGRTVW